VIIITARGGENERIKGLKKGADDYIPKPFSIRELLARVEAVLRRCRVPQEEPSPSHKQLGQGQYDVQLSILIDAQGQHVPLSEKENELMTYFLQHPQRIISRDELLQRVWRVSAQKLETRTVDMNISRLRDKLKRIFPHGQALKTQRGQGYIFQGDLA
jgi:DNA-binding response OmpR family regulator